MLSKIKKIIADKRVPVLLVGASMFVLTFLFLLESPINIWMKGESTIDSSVFRYIGIMMTKGGVPYRDTFDHKGPLIYLYNFLGALINKDYGVWCFEFLNLFATFAFMYKIARLKCGRFASLFTVFLCSPLLYECFGGGNYTEEYAMPFVALALYIFIDYFLNDKINVPRLILCGISFGGVLLLRPNMIAVWIAFCIFVLVKTLITKDFQSLFKFILWFVAGAVIIILPFVIYLAANGALEKCIEYYITYNFAYSSGSFMSYKWTRWRCFTDFASQPMMLFSIVLLIYEFCSKCSLKKLVGIEGSEGIEESEQNNLRENGVKESIFIILYLIFMFINILLMSVAGISAEHYALISFPVIAYPVSILSKKCELSEQKTPGALQGGAMAIAAYICVVVALPLWLATFHEAEWKYERQWYDNISEDTRRCADFIQEYTDENDTISMVGNWNIIYIVSGRMAATRFSFLEPTGLYDEQYFKALNKACPALVLCRQERVNDPRLVNFIESNDYVKIFEENDIVMWGLK